MQNKVEETIGANLLAHARNGLCSFFCILSLIPPPARKRGIGDDLQERVVLSVMLVDKPKLAVPLYHSKAAPDFTEQHEDNIYVSTVVDDGGATVRDGNARMADLFASGAAVIPKRVEEIIGKASWLATYDRPACKIHYRLRSRVRFHNLVGPHAISLKERMADFAGSVVVGRSFARFPSTGGNVAPMRGLGIPVPGRQWKYVAMKRKTKLRRWIEELFQL